MLLKDFMLCSQKNTKRKGDYAMEKLNFVNLDSADIEEIEEIVTPNWGFYDCCH